VDYTGVPVHKGDHMVYIYSPELLTAQEELLGSRKATETLAKSGLASMRETAERTVDAAREKLRLWGLTEEQVAEIERKGSPSDHVTIYSPMSGIVVDKNALEGMYVDTGMRIYTIADLSQVWVKLDAYESDIQWIRYGQKTEIQAEAYPGPSVVIAYSPCINHGLRAGMGKTQLESKLAVECGYWSLYRYNPLLEAQGKNPFILDSKEPNWDKFNDFLMGEVRYSSLRKAFPDQAEALFKAAKEDAMWRYNRYRKLAQSEEK